MKYPFNPHNPNKKQLPFENSQNKYKRKIYMRHDFEAIMKTAEKFKAVMLKKNLVKARCKCPHCDKGIIHGFIANDRKKHFSMQCDNKLCNIMMME